LLDHLLITLDSHWVGLTDTAFIRADALGHFTTHGYPPGRYAVQVQFRAPGSEPGGWAFETATLGTTNVADEILTLAAADVSGVVITLTNRLGQITGSVSSMRSSASARVVVFPADRRVWDTASRRVVKITGTDAHGGYRIPDLPAGAYRLIAVSDDDEIAPRDTIALFEALAPHAEAVTLARGERLTKDLSVQTIR
jgi:hypothetical protein